MPDEDKCGELRVELHQAFMWDCPHCGVENFQRGVTIHMTDEELLESGIEASDFESWRTATTAPCKVKCHDCERQFKATEDDDDDDHELPDPCS